MVLPAGFSDGALTPAATAQLKTELDRLTRAGHRRFAVRSSALAEDSATDSFAGQFDTELDIPAEGVPAAVLRVHQSQGSARVAAYTTARNTAADLTVAVVVQAMVAAEYSGVLFTVHPITTDLSLMLGNTIAGLGEPLVSGEVTGEEFTIERPAGHYDGPAALAGFGRRLHDLGHDAETVFDGLPQDVEWCVAEGRLWLLQSRPITTLTTWDPATAARNDSAGGTCLWSATNLTEANPIPQTPLTISLSDYKQRNGGPTMRLRGREMAGYIGGRPYANLSVQITARRGRKATKSVRQVADELAGIWGKVPPEVPIPLIPLTETDWRSEGLSLLGSLLRLGRHRLGLDSFLRKNPLNCSALHRRIGECATAEELVQLWQQQIFPASLVAFWSVICATSEAPARLEAELAGLVGAADAAALVSNIAGLAGEPESLGPVLGLQAVRAGKLDRAAYLDRWGHRGVNEIELAWPRPQEEPGWLDTALARLADTAVLSIGGNEAAFQAAADRLRVAAPRRANRYLARLRRVARQAVLREKVRSESVRFTAVERAFALRAGELLDIGDSVFYLTITDLVAALSGDPRGLATVPARREQHRKELALPDLPGLIVGHLDPFTWAQDPDRRTDVAGSGIPSGPVTPDFAEQPLLTGFPGSPGVVTAVVRRVDRIEDSGSLQPGEILLTRLTNIGWTPVFPRAAGIITDLGAPLSHAAIVARELGVPAVVGCHDATSRLHTGDLVRLDGAAGQVELLTPAATMPR